MKILVLQDYLRSGGTERQAVELTAGFRQAGEEAALVTFRPGGVLKVPADVPRIALQSTDLTWDWYAPGLRKLVRKQSPDIILAMGRMANCHLGLLNAKHRIATFRTGKPLPYLFRRSLAKADHVVANSAEAAATLTARYGVSAEKITVIYNGLLSAAAVPPHAEQREAKPASSEAAPALGESGRRMGVSGEATSCDTTKQLSALDRRASAGAPPPPDRGIVAATSGDAATALSRSAEGADHGSAFADLSSANKISSLSPSRDTSSRAAARILVCVAMFRPEKNQRELIQIVAGLPTEPRWELWLAGDGPARRECEEFAKRLKVADRVKFLGLVHDPRSLYRQADIAVHASASEALSNFLIEAQAHGLPAVAYDAQGIAETFIPNRTGWVIPRGDRAAFRSALLRLMTEPTPSLAAEAAAFARQRFDPAAQIQSYLALFQRMVSLAP